jgi:hypothetical protein
VDPSSEEGEAVISIVGVRRTKLVLGFLYCIPINWSGVDLCVVWTD